MLFKQFYDTDLAQGSYFIACQATGEAIVIDPRRDIQVYLDEAAAQGMKIIAVTETHIHADYLSGSRELAHKTGAKLYLSDEGDEDWKYAFANEKLYHNAEIKIGKLSLKVLHTPGHTPEHISFLLTDGGFTTEAGYLLSGDFVFVGDLGRPDLLDEAAGATDSRFDAAKQLFESLRDKFVSLADYIQVWPGHGAGSACGKALGAVASTTVGYEKRFSWWASYVKNNDLEGFSKILLAGQPDVPTYFARMKLHNKTGPALLEQQALQEYLANKTQHEIGKSFIFIDTRVRSVYEQAALEGALHIPFAEKFVTYASYIIDPEADTRPIVVLAKNEQEASEMRDRLVRVGIDKVVGFARSLEGVKLEPIKLMSINEFKNTNDIFVLDVRTANEYAEGHIAGAQQIHAGKVLWEFYELPENKPIVAYCRSGARVAVAMSALRAMGFDNIYELEGSWLAWQKEKPANVP